MASLSDSVKRVKNVLDNIGAAIADKGVTVPEGTKAGKYPALIEQIKSGVIDKETDYAHMFRDNHRIDLIMKGNVNTSHAKDLSYMAYNGKNLTQVKNIDFSSAEDTSYMFYNCPNLTYINDDAVLVLPKAKYTNYMFAYCANIRNVSRIVMPSIVNAAYMFQYGFTGAGITLELPSYVENATNMFTQTKLASVTIDSDTVIKNAGSMFYSCNVVSIKGLNLSGASAASDYSGIFSNCGGLQHLELSGEIKNFDIAFSTNTYLTHASLINILNALCENGTARCTLGSNNLVKLTEEEKAIATNKGWTLA